MRLPAWTSPPFELPWRPNAPTRSAARPTESAGPAARWGPTTSIEDWHGLRATALELDDAIAQGDGPFAGAGVPS